MLHLRVVVAFKENLSGGGYFGYKPNKGINDNNNLIPGAAPPPFIASEPPF